MEIYSNSIGFTGKEGLGLGGGQKAIFRLEGGFDSDTGSPKSGTLLKLFPAYRHLPRRVLQMFVPD
ncbi:hypothetical protein [Trinickia mobilis]|uniref:hypothetical protein n=1 Tax=Trinickia mobilis TaxID=2816356 RepID=UPI001A8FEAED|nr:hypothetical protein [Trinickia mobilis]